ncbi:MAG: outer membrane protein assembly factor BamD [Phycisphaerales bacterium]|nr:outer membrane protein assembly factor BamD [Phycisphaerales bacterium]
MKHLWQALALCVACGTAAAQPRETLGTDGTWRPLAPASGSADEALMNQARQLIAQGKTDQAASELTKWLERQDRVRNPWYPEALMLRASARLAGGDEFESLYDFEQVIRDYPGSENFVAALEKESEVAELYLKGRRKKVLGLRLESGIPVATEILLRINERLPGSKLAERSLLRLADYYYEQRELEMAGETYDVFLSLYPRSEHRAKALQRRVYANITRFKGPAFDATSLQEAQYQIEDFQREFPIEAQRVGMTDALAARVEESRAEQLLLVARYYLEDNDRPAARLTLSRLIRTYPGTGAAQRGLEAFEKEGWTLPGAAAAEAGPAPTPAPSDTKATGGAL